jgi:formylglycine-generating enzyme required for sulfatase activity
MEFVWVPALNMWVGKYEVTNDEYQKKDPAHDSRDYKGYRLTGARQPVVYVNFEDACAYAEWLTAADKATGKLPKDHKYRLPSEDEWKIFAKGDDDRMYPWGGEWPPVSGQAGNYDDETVFDSISVDGGYQDGAPVTCDVEKSWKNPAGLYGVGGNVWEPTSSNSGDNVFAAWHGGSWLVSSPVALQCNHGVAGGGSDRTKDYGFRLVLAGPEED